MQYRIKDDLKHSMPFGGQSVWMIAPNGEHPLGLLEREGPTKPFVYTFLGSVDTEVCSWAIRQSLSSRIRSHRKSTSIGANYSANREHRHSVSVENHRLLAIQSDNCHRRALSFMVHTSCFASCGTET